MLIILFFFFSSYYFRWLFSPSLATLSILNALVSGCNSGQGWVSNSTTPGSFNNTSRNKLFFNNPSLLFSNRQHRTVSRVGSGLIISQSRARRFLRLFRGSLRRAPTRLHLLRLPCAMLRHFRLRRPTTRIHRPRRRRNNKLCSLRLRARRW